MCNNYPNSGHIKNPANIETLNMTFKSELKTFFKKGRKILHSLHETPRKETFHRIPVKKKSISVIPLTIKNSWTAK